MSEAEEKRHKRKLIERILKNWQSWGALVQSQGLFTIVVEGEEYHYYDMLKGLSALPPRQREAVWLMCVQDLSEIATAKRMGFENTVVTPVQQYKSYGLSRLVDYLEATPEIQEEMVAKVAKYGKSGPRKKRTKKVVV